MLDVLDPGDKYDKLKESYIIFICTFDEFEKGRHKYSFENTCVEDPSIKLKDGAHKIFLCAGGVMDDCSEKMKDFLDYVAGTFEQVVRITINKNAKLISEKMPNPSMKECQTHQSKLAKPINAWYYC